MAATQNFEIDQGATWEQTLLWKDADEAPIDLTGYTARLQIRESIAAADPPILSLTTENSRIVLGEVEDPPGTVAYNILLTIAAADTTTLPTGNAKVKWFYDLEMIAPGGAVDRLIQGKFVVLPNVTR